MNRIIWLLLTAFVPNIICSEPKPQLKQTAQAEYKQKEEERFNAQASEDLLKAAEDLDLEGVKKALANKANINIQGSYGDTPLIKSVLESKKEECRLAIVKRLLQEPDVAVNIFNDRTGPAINMAMLFEHFKIVELLVDVPSINLNLVGPGHYSLLGGALSYLEMNEEYEPLVKKLLLNDARLIGKREEISLNKVSNAEISKIIKDTNCYKEQCKKETTKFLLGQNLSEKVIAIIHAMAYRTYDEACVVGKPKNADACKKETSKKDFSKVSAQESAAQQTNEATQNSSTEQLFKIAPKLIQELTQGHATLNANQIQILEQLRAAAQQKSCLRSLYIEPFKRLVGVLGNGLKAMCYCKKKDKKE